MNTENNKLLAEFMGVFDNIRETEDIYSWNDAPFFYTTENSKEKVIENISNYVKYFYSWDSIMPVVYKIEELGYEVTIYTYYVIIGLDNIYSEEEETGEHILVEGSERNTRIHFLYDACVQFVKWYNEQNK
jgi:hypothetical protein